MGCVIPGGWLAATFSFGGFSEKNLAVSLVLLFMTSSSILEGTYISAAASYSVSAGALVIHTLSSYLKINSNFWLSHCLQEKERKQGPKKDSFCFSKVKKGENSPRHICPDLINTTQRRSVCRGNS